MWMELSPGSAVDSRGPNDLDRRRASRRWKVVQCVRTKISCFSRTGIAVMRATLNHCLTTYLPFLYDRHQLEQQTIWDYSTRFAVLRPKKAVYPVERIHSLGLLPAS